ncbi:hypothetical protein [Endozoicomonas sp. Mp262]|uniref:hypothetical protein n=1 Tax=Endozoicomonas sp. Mp262 TaxID=2919499 RepID=UPI0021D98FCF
MVKATAAHTLLAFLILLTGCQGSVSGLYRDGFPGTASWSILPFINYSQAEGVGAQVERMLFVLLPSVGVDNPVLYPDSVASGSTEKLAKPGSLKRAKNWADVQGVGFAIGGEIQDWFIDRDGRPQVALTLYVTDARTGQGLWSVSGASEGMAGENIHKVCQNLIVDLLESMPVNRRQ